MLKTLLFYCSLVYLLTTQTVYAGEKTTIQWSTNYAEAVNQARLTSKPLLLYFTGSDWCGWCGKLEKDVFQANEFIKRAGQQFIYIKVDFPLYTSQNKELIEQNKELQKKYGVRSFPYVVILENLHLQPIGITGYRPGGGASYATHLNKFVNEYTQYMNNMQEVGERKFSPIEIKQLFEKSKELGLHSDTVRLMKEGMNSDAPLYFMIERYRLLAEEGQIHEEEAKHLKKQLLALDKDNLFLAHYQIAIIDFEAYTEEMNKEHYAIELTVEPLLSYIESFGDRDRDNLWRLLMIISQVYLDQNRTDEALKYAHSSYHNAPSSVQPDIAMTIENIRKNKNNTELDSKVGILEKQVPGI